MDEQGGFITSESVSGAALRLVETQPSAFRIVAPTGRPLLTIYGDGTVEVDNLDDASEAAQVFVTEVRRLWGYAAS